MCVQVWVVCLSADGRPHSGVWLLRVFVLVSTLVLVVVCACMGVVLFPLHVCFFCDQRACLCAHVFSLRALLLQV